MATSDNSDVLEKLWATDPRHAMQAEMQQAKLTAQQYEKYAQLAAQSSQQLNQAYGQQLGGMISATSTASSTLGQLQNAYGANVPTTWTTTTTPMAYPTHDAQSEFHQLVILQAINLIANFGPTVAKKIATRWNIRITGEEIDQIHKDLTKTIAGDDDPDLEKVINDAVKEVKL